MKLSKIMQSANLERSCFHLACMQILWVLFFFWLICMGVDIIIFDHNALTLKKMGITLSLIPSHFPPPSKPPSRNRCQPSTQLSIGVPHSLLQALIIGKLLELENRYHSGGHDGYCHKVLTYVRL